MTKKVLSKNNKAEMNQQIRSQNKQITSESKKPNVSKELLASGWQHWLLLQKQLLTL